VLRDLMVLTSRAVHGSCMCSWMPWPTSYTVPSSRCRILPAIPSRTAGFLWPNAWPACSSSSSSSSSTCVYLMVCRSRHCIPYRPGQVVIRGSEGVTAKVVLA